MVGRVIHSSSGGLWHHGVFLMVFDRMAAGIGRRKGLANFGRDV
jgi:hypothetical protein